MVLVTKFYVFVLVFWVLSSQKLVMLIRHKNSSTKVITSFEISKCVKVLKLDFFIFIIFVNSFILEELFLWAHLVQNTCLRIKIMQKRLILELFLSLLKSLLLQFSKVDIVIAQFAESFSYDDKTLWNFTSFYYVLTKRIPLCLHVTSNRNKHFM